MKRNRLIIASGVGLQCSIAIGNKKAFQVAYEGALDQDIAVVHASVTNRLRVSGKAGHASAQTHVLVGECSK